MCVKLEIINSCDTSKGYLGKFTKKELRIIKYTSKGRVINLFSGSSKFGNIRIDFSNKNATQNIDVFTWLENLSTENCYPQTVIIDAPYNQRFANEYQKLGNTLKQFIIFANTIDTTRLFNLIEKRIKPEIIILKSWNYYVPKGYELKKGFLCYAGGFRKSPILLILKRKIRKFFVVKK